MRLLSLDKAANYKSSAQRFGAGSLLYGRLRPYLNKIVCADFDGICSGELLVFPPQNLLCSGYLQYVLHSARFVSFASHLKEGDRPRVDFAELSSYPIPLPPLPEQRRIVAEIEEQLTRLESAESLLRVAEQKAEVLLRRAVAPCDLHASNSPPPLPVGWRWTTAQDVCGFITKGTTPASVHLLRDGDIPYIKVNNLTFQGRLDFGANATFISPEVHEKQLARSEVLPGDVLMNIVGPPLGKISIVPPTYPRWNMNQAVARFRPATAILSEYLAVVLRSQFTLRWLLKMTKATVGQVNLTLETCRAVPIPLRLWGIRSK
jgi:type I restriction enzyme, S subunit